MSVKQLYLLLLDISGYTDFVVRHRSDRTHAERILTELLNAIVSRAQPPLVPHKLEGDAVFFYAESPATPDAARALFQQLQNLFVAFQTRERELISECTICKCEACKTVGKLRLKAIMHYGAAVVSRIGQFEELTGEDVILVHRLLKNSIPHSEYILASESFEKVGGPFTKDQPEERRERLDDLGETPVWVYYPSPPSELGAPTPLSSGLLRRIHTFLILDFYYIRRLFTKPPRRYRHLEALAGEDG